MRFFVVVVLNSLLIKLKTKNYLLKLFNKQKNEKKKNILKRNKILNK